MSLIIDKKYLKYLCEKLAYVCFIEDKDDQLKRLGLTHQNIEEFNVRAYINKYINDTSNEIEATVQTLISVKLLDNDAGKTHKITILYHHPVFSPAICKKVIDPNSKLDFDIVNYKFSRPNPISLYDAEFGLEESLGVYVNE